MQNKLALSAVVCLFAGVNGDNQIQTATPFYPAHSLQAEAAPLSYSSPSSYGDPTPVEAQPQVSSFDPTLIVIPLLVVAGLSLLFPTITNVITRKRRSGKDTHKNTRG
jgi:hypothetical protein